jgi:membrane protease YdiL (CAAX protease family)
MGFASVHEFMSGWRTLLSSAVFVPWLVVGLVNPWFEESYWRGALIDAAGRWKMLGVVYSAMAFAASHPLIWGVHSIALRRPAAMVGLVVAGTVWGVAYWRSGSLRWTIVGHGCADLLGLSVPVLLNLYLPAWAR